MSERAPDLIIPVNLDVNPAREALRAFQQDLDRQVARATAGAGGGGGTGGGGDGSRARARAAREQEEYDQQYIRAVKLKLKAEADLAADIFRRIKEREAEQDKADADYVRAVKKRLAAEKQLADEKARAIKDARAEQDKADADYIRAVNKRLAAEKQLEKQKEADARKAQREQEKEEKDYVRAVYKKLAAEKQLDEEKRRAIEKQQEETKKLVGAFINLQVVKNIAGWVKEAMQAIGQSVADAREHVRGLISEMEKARTEAKEIAALRGKEPTAGFTAAMAREAAAAGVDAGQYQQFSEAWEAHAGQYIGKEGETPAQLAAQGKRINKEQSIELQQQVAGYAMGARGIKSGDEAAQLMALIMAKSRAGASNDEIIGNYAKMMKVAELAPGRTAPQLAQITELGMENVGPQGDMQSVLDAATLTRVMAQRNPNEASTYGRALMRGMRQIRMNQKQMSELGIEKGMGFREQLMAIDKAAQKHVAGGGDQGEFLSKYFNDIREWGAISTALNEGVHGGAFQRAEQEAAGINADTARAAIEKYRKSQEGRAARDRSEILATQREQAEAYVELRHAQSEARGKVIGSHELEQGEGPIGAILTLEGQMFGQGNREEQLVRSETGRILRERLLMSRAGQEWLIDQGGYMARKLATQMGGDRRDIARRVGESIFNRATSEDLLADAANTLKKINENLEKQANRPLVPQMPAGGRRN